MSILRAEKDFNAGTIPGNPWPRFAQDEDSVDVVGHFHECIQVDPGARKRQPAPDIGDGHACRRGMEICAVDFAKNRGSMIGANDDEVRSWLGFPLGDNHALSGRV